jgi:uncharacterized protein (DUF433 family)
MSHASKHRDLTANEVAVLAEVPPRLVRKAIEERVLTPCDAWLPGPRRTLRKALSADAVGYMAVMREIDWPIPIEGKRRIAEWLRIAEPESLGTKLVIQGPILLDVQTLKPKIKAAWDRTTRYRRARAVWIVSDEAIMGGTPVIKGTRVTVYSVLGRIEAGEHLDAVAKDHPDIPWDALEAAVIFAKANPMRGRPSGRPWARAA